jgi:hypothetical protein
MVESAVTDIWVTTKPNIRHCFSIGIWLYFKMIQGIAITHGEMKLHFGCLFEWLNIGCNLIDQHLNQI